MNSLEKERRVLFLQFFVVLISVFDKFYSFIVVGLKAAMVK